MSQTVSVVIPAYNAAATIGETLDSVRGQSHRELEIIVVDDGSTDATCEIVNRHAMEDGRVSLIRQTNGGVAAARNRGWKTAASDLIAFLDADDLWGPDKIERQLAALMRAGPTTGLVYCWYAVIDSDSMIVYAQHKPTWEGDVLDRLLTGNFVGNGSAALVRRQALIDAAGFESGLFHADAQGCEDILFYLRVARRWHFAVVPDRLVGYRFTLGNMSSNSTRMLRSWLLVAQEMTAALPEKKAAIEAGVLEYAAQLGNQLLTTGGFTNFAPIAVIARQLPPRLRLRLAVETLPRIVFRQLRRRFSSFVRSLAGRSAPPPVGRKFTIGNDVRP